MVSQITNGLSPIQPVINTINTIVDNLPTSIKPNDIVNSSVNIGNQTGVAIIDKASDIRDTILSCVVSYAHGTPVCWLTALCVYAF